MTILLVYQIFGCICENFAAIFKDNVIESLGDAIIMSNVKGTPLTLNALINYQEGAIVSKELLRKDTGTITLFAFDAGQGLSEHTAPFDATVIVIDGVADIKIGDEKHKVSSGEMIIMPANIVHAVFASERFKMLLIMIRSEK